uniref:Uncharacterized protein n=1 Tax=viral metagenome TaxID=1070528 RepID=A0A6M3IRD3_9ZZZZ
MTDIGKLLDFYISLKRIFYNKPIARPKPETKDYNNLIRLGVLLDENGINYEDYILVNIQAYRKRKVFPRVDQLLGLKALNRYNEYARRKYKIGKTFRADTHSVCVYSTNIYYPIEEFHKPMDQDLKILMIWSFVKEGKVVFEKEKATKIWEILEYLIAKYELNGLEVPDSVLKWKKQLEEEREKV